MRNLIWELADGVYRVFYEGHDYEGPRHIPHLLLRVAGESVAIYISRQWALANDWDAQGIPVDAIPVRRAEANLWADEYRLERVDEVEWYYARLAGSWTPR